MIYAIVASIQRDELVPKRGTGKTNTMAFYSYRKFQNGRRVITNFWTPFSEMMSITDVICLLLDDILEERKALKEGKEYNSKLNNAEICLTEFQTSLDNLGHKQLKKRIWRLVVSQSRKVKLNFWLDMQILKQVDVDARDHVDRIIIPEKHHMDGSRCLRDDCEKEHLIYVYFRQPFILRPMKILNATKVGKLYDTNKITIDPIDIGRLLKYKELFGDLKVKAPKVTI